VDGGARTSTISVCLPALDEAPTIGAMVRTLGELQADGVIDEVLVLDGGSRDETATEAARAGASVFGWQDIRPELGPTLGKGDSMWRALQLACGEIVCFLDADLVSFGASYVTRLTAPLLADRELGFVKSTFERPLRLPSTPPGRRQGGRVTEAVGRPLLALLYPDLARFRQPLSGQIAARRGVLERLSFPVGYGVDAALLIDAYRRCGLDRMAEVDLGELLTVHQDAEALERMAGEVASVIVARAQRDGVAVPAEASRFSAMVRSQPAERPPLVQGVAAGG
jgi:glucosyl-3-phosphoglycerate synthase